MVTLPGETSTLLKTIITKFYVNFNNLLGRLASYSEETTKK